MELEIKHLTKKYGDKLALDRFSYSFHEGIYGILGANGAGKSTLMHLITDNVGRTAGEILLGGTDVLKLGDEFRKILGFMPQQQGLYEGLSCESFLAYMARLKGIGRRQLHAELDRVLSLTNLSDKRHVKIGAFSGGMKQRTLLAQAMLGEPKLLILDEPTAGLDPKERIRLRNYIRDLGQNRIVLLATHIVSDIEAIADDILLLKQGRIVRSGSPAALIAALPAGLTPLLGGVFSLDDVYLHYLGEDESVGALTERPPASGHPSDDPEARP
ncbi:MAG: ATP-binding cassette domain-containing protein [Oscillospiraceae bacterium]|nr:ATP-binding cassette domain-containing protein [Oscillospiraceae bacterium]